MCRKRLYPYQRVVCSLLRRSFNGSMADAIAIDWSRYNLAVSSDNGALLESIVKETVRVSSIAL